MPVAISEVFRPSRQGSRLSSSSLVALLRLARANTRHTTYPASGNNNGNFAFFLPLNLSFPFSSPGSRDSIIIVRPPEEIYRGPNIIIVSYPDLSMNY